MAAEALGGSKTCRGEEGTGEHARQDCWAEEGRRQQKRKPARLDMHPRERITQVSGSEKGQFDKRDFGGRLVDEETKRDRSDVDRAFPDQYAGERRFDNKP